jgi:hypothetical protein
VQRINTRCFTLHLPAERGTSERFDCKPHRPTASPAPPLTRRPRWPVPRRIPAKQRDSRRNSEFKEIRSADQRTGSSHRMLHFQPFHQSVSDARVEIDLQRDGHGNEQHVGKTSGDVIRLKNKMKIKVVNNAAMVSGAKLGSRMTSNQVRPYLPVNQIHSRVPATRGTTINTITVKDEAPCTRKCTMGTSSSSMMRSSTDTWTSV